MFARNLRPMLRESFMEDDDIDLNDVALSHYRLSIIRQQDVQLLSDPAKTASFAKVVFDLLTLERSRSQYIFP